MQNRIARLGKALVQSLDLESGVDTLSKWMAHYIAEQLVTIKKVNGTKKQDAEQRCFDTILQLWNHRAVMPGKSRPFSSFDPILNTLERLDPNSAQTFFTGLSAFRNADEKEEINKSKKRNDIDSIIELAVKMDVFARTILQYILKCAAQKANDSKTKMWLKNAIEKGERRDLQIIYRLIGASERKTDPLETACLSHIEYLKNVASQINQFTKFSNSLQSGIKREITAWEKELIKIRRGIKNKKP